MDRGFLVGAWFERDVPVAFCFYVILLNKRGRHIAGLFLICAFLFFTAFFISYLRYSFSVFFTPAKIEEEA